MGRAVALPTSGWKDHVQERSSTRVVELENAAGKCRANPPELQHSEQRTSNSAFGSRDPPLYTVRCGQPEDSIPHAGMRMLTETMSKCDEHTQRT